MKLKMYQASVAEFSELKRLYASKIEYTDNIAQYFSGYKENRRTKFYCGWSKQSEYLVMIDVAAGDIIPDNEVSDGWRQIIVRQQDALTEDLAVDGIRKPTIRGGQASRWLSSTLKLHYTDEEIAAKYAQHSVEYNPKYKQYNFKMPIPVGHLVKYTNCYKFDINSAHGDALREIFGCDEFNYMYRHRKQNPEYKDYLNYSVGNMVNEGHTGTYNWIVQRTTKKLLDAIEYCGGILVYANTDGFIVQNPTQLLPISDKLGEWKLEYQGDVYEYQGENYIIFQTGSKYTGTLIEQGRTYLDLPNGVVIEAERVGVGPDNNKTYHLENIKTKKVEVEIDNG